MGQTRGPDRPGAREIIAGSLCCVTGMTCQSLSSKWPAAKARRGSMSFATRDRDATQAPGHFQLNPPGRSSLVEFRRRSLGQPRMLSGQAFRWLLEIRPNSLRRLASHTGYTTLTGLRRSNDSLKPFTVRGELAHNKLKLPPASGEATSSIALRKSDVVIHRP